MDKVIGSCPETGYGPAGKESVKTWMFQNIAKQGYKQATKQHEPSNYK